MHIPEHNYKFDLKAVTELIRGLSRAPVNEEAVFCGPYENVQEILQQEFGITTSDDIKSTLATYGLGPCTSILGYGDIQDLTTGSPLTIGFLTHLQPTTNIDITFGILLYNLLRLTKRQPICFQSRIVGGLRGMSEKRVEQLRRKLTIPLRKDITFNLVEEKVLGRKSIDAVLDVKNRQVYYNYDPLQNPFRRELLEQWKMGVIYHCKTPSLVYFPSNLQ